MGALLVYMLKAGFCLTVFYLFYKWLLSKETYHRFNRLTLLGIILLSLLLPFCKFSIAHHTEVQQTMFSIEQLLSQYDRGEEVLSNQHPISTSFQWMHWLLLVYIVGILFVFGKQFYSLFQIIRTIKKGKREPIQGGNTLVTYPKTITPFSWMRYIVISKEDLQENKEAILAHEMAHIRNKHSIDLLFVDIFLLFQWFNPAAWLLRQELQNIHEYEADESVIEQGIDAKNYQLLLIKKAAGTRLYSMANSFNHSKLKKRITMMVKEKSSSWARLKYLYILPLAAVTVSAFARPEVSNLLEELSSVKVTELIPETKSIQQPDSTAGEILIVDGVLQLGTTKFDYREDEHGETYPFLKSVENPKEETKSIQEPDSLETTVDKPVKVIEVGRRNGTSITILNSSDENDSIKVRGVNINNPPLLIINDKKIPYDQLDKIDVKTIRSMSVLKDTAAIDIYGKEGKNGVILMTTSPYEYDEEYEEDEKNADEGRQLILDENGFPTIKNKPIMFGGVDISNFHNLNFNAENPPLFSFDDKKEPLFFFNDKRTPCNQLNKIIKEELKKSFSISTSGAGYGDAGRYGVIRITTVAYEESLEEQEIK